MRKERENQLRNEINDLIGERVMSQLKYKDAEEVICIIRDVMKILNQEFPDEKVDGFILEWHRENDYLGLGTYPSGIFPSGFDSGEEQQKLAKRVRKAKCESSELSKIIRFFSENEHIDSQFTERKGEIETYELVFK